LGQKLEKIADYFQIERRTDGMMLRGADLKRFQYEVDFAIRAACPALTHAQMRRPPLPSAPGPLFFKKVVGTQIF
jgi:hypothetical protein